MSMNVAPARVGASALACLIAVGLALAAGERAVSAQATWRDALQRAEAALAGGDVREAQQAWQEAYRAVMGESPSVSRSSCSSSMRYISRIDQALELGALYVVAGSGVEIQGYARGDRTSRDRSGRKYSGQRRAVT